VDGGEPGERDRADGGKEWKHDGPSARKVPRLAAQPVPAADAQDEAERARDENAEHRTVPAGGIQQHRTKETQGESDEPELDPTP
jgi:hypothetical protein